jgi:hypothetical protein
MSTSEIYWPRHPVYIISKGRWQSRHTSKTFEKMGIPYYIAVEPQEYEKYAAVIDPAKILTLPFSNHGMGSGPARNWIWEHSIANGHERHWCVDDNIRDFYRFHYNQRVKVESGSIFKAMEDFCDRYENIALASPQYKMFTVDDYHYPAIVQNTRMMSCILIKNDIPFRWRGKYNEDVDLSIRVLKAGYCTIQFFAFLQDKLQTGLVKGGNTSEIYGDGTLEKSKMLVDLHPDIVTLVQRYNRWHHAVDLRSLRGNKLILKPDVIIPEEPNEYGLALYENWHTDNPIKVDKPSPRRTLKVEA